MDFLFHLDLQRSVMSRSRERGALTVKFEYRCMISLRYARYSALVFAVRFIEAGSTRCLQSGDR